MPDEVETEIVQEEPGTSMVPVDSRTPVGLPPGSTLGLSNLGLKDEQIKALARPVDPETEVEIMSDGVVYMPWIVVAKRLDDAVGVGQWALRQEGPPLYDADEQEYAFDGSLWICGKFAARAMGGQRWKPKNPRMTRTAAIEGARSDCLRKCAKHVGVAHELWDPDWRRKYKAEYATKRRARNRVGKEIVVWAKRSGRPAISNDFTLVGEFPPGKSPDSVIPKGTDAGTALRDLDSATLERMAMEGRDQAWKLAVEAEIERRKREAKMQPEESEPSDE